LDFAPCVLLSAFRAPHGSTRRTRGRRLKPAIDPWIELPDRGRRPLRGEPGRWLAAHPAPPPRDALGLLFGTTWAILTLPFRLVFGIVGLLSRLTGLVTGFSMMVAGAALSAGPLAMLGIPLFVVGLLVAMRSIG
jgi:hypothetical protein